MPGFAGGGLQDENVKLPHGVSTTSLGTSLQPGGSKETLPSPPATPAANTTAYTPPTSVVKALDAFHVTSPPQAAPPNDSVSVATENDSAENVEPILPDNQLGLSPSQLPGSPEPVPPKKRVPSDPPPPIQGPPPEAPKGQGSSQDLRVSGAVPGEGSGEGPEKEGKKTTDKNKYKDGTYWKSCTQRLKAMNQYIVNVLVYTVLTVFIWGFGTMWNQIGKGRWRQVKTSSSCSKHQRAATCPIWSWWLHIDRHTLCKLCAHIYVHMYDACSKEINYGTYCWSMALLRLLRWRLWNDRRKRKHTNLKADGLTKYIWRKRRNGLSNFDFNSFMYTRVRCAIVFFPCVTWNPSP